MSLLLSVFLLGALLVSPMSSLPTTGIGLSPGILLAEEGPVGGQVPDNVGRVRGKPFASGTYSPSFLIDGQYGLSHTWKSNFNPPNFIGVSFKHLTLVSSLAFGRDNHGRRTDFISGNFVLAYTVKANPGPDTVVTEIADTGWKTIGWMNYSESGGTGLFTFPALRHRYTIIAPVKATGIRLLVPAGIENCTRGTCVDITSEIDELEINPPSAGRETYCTGATSISACATCATCKASCMWDDGNCLPNCDSVREEPCVDSLISNCKWDADRMACSSISATGCGWGLPDVCLSIQGCSWNGTLNSCQISPNHKCEYGEKVSCLSDKRCVWAISQDTNRWECALIPQRGCSSETMADCVKISGCTWSSDTWSRDVCTVSYDTYPTQCGYAESKACDSVMGCMWEAATRHCVKDTPTTPCGYQERTACQSIAGCVYNNSCVVSPNQECKYGDEVVCEAQECTWSDKNCTKDCTKLRTESSCKAMSCFWNPDVLECKKDFRCPELRQESTCRAQSSRCVWNGTCISKVCDELTTASSCVLNSANCQWYETATPQCFSKFFTQCSLQTTKGNCEGRDCEWRSTTQQCSQRVILAECAKAFVETCYSFSVQCYYHEFNKNCTNVNTLHTEIAPITGVLITPPAPQPGQSFGVALYGNKVQRGDTLAFVKGNASCPSFGNASAWTIVLTTFDGERRSYSSAASALQWLSATHAGTYAMCVRLMQVKSVIRLTGVLSVKAASAEISRVTFHPPSPKAKETFAITFTGSNFLKTNRFQLIPKDQECSTWDEMSEVASVSTSFRHTTGLGYVEQIGTYEVCYAGDQEEILKANIALHVTQLAAWRNATAIEENLDKRTAEVSLLNGTRLPYHRFHRTAVCSDDNRIRVIMDPQGADIVLGDTQRPYASGQVCPYVLAPYNQEDRTKAIILSLLRVFVDDTDYFMVFTPSSNSIAPVCSLSITDQTTCYKRGCLFRNNRCESKLPSGSYFGSCPVSVQGYNLAMTYTYSSFSLSDITQRTLSLPLNFLAAPSPQDVLVVLCTGRSPPRFTGFHLAYKTQKTLCPNDCTDSSGEAHGVCSGTTCLCDFGYRGADCSERPFCSGLGRQSAVLRVPSLSLHVSVASVDVCGYHIQPEPSRDNTLERMGSFYIALQITSLSIQNPNCDKSYVLLRQESETGTVIDTLCSSMSRSKIYYVNSQRAYLHFSPSHKTDSFTLTYKVVTATCPGPIAPGATKPLQSEECDGRGVCEQDSTVYTDINSVSPYMASCRCYTPYGKSRPLGTCDICGFGYSQDSFPSCTDSVRCIQTTNASLNECGNGTCTVNGTCLCAANYYGNRCEEYVSPSLEDSFEYRKFMKIRFSFDGTASNTGSAEIPDTTLFPCQLPGAKFTCEAGPARSVGKRYQMTNQLAANVSRSRRSILQEQKQRQEDQSMYFNRVVVDNAFRDLIRTMPVRDTDLDVAIPLTVMSWVKVGRRVNGFLLAKQDAVFTSSGSSPILDKALHDVKDRSLPKSALLLGHDSLSLYFAIHLNGPADMVTLIMVKGGNRNRDNPSRDSYHVVRHFRLATTLFDDTWRFLVITIGTTLGRLEAQIYINGKSDASLATYVQCLPFPPTTVRAGVPVESGTGQMRVLRGSVVSSIKNDTLFNTVVAGGALVVGYHFQGSLDEVRVYNKKLDPFAIVAIAGAFAEELQVQKTALYAMAGVGIVCILLSLSFPIWRYFVGKSKEKIREERRQKLFNILRRVRLMSHVVRRLDEGTQPAEDLSQMSRVKSVKINIVVEEQMDSSSTTAPVEQAPNPDVPGMICLDLSEDLDATNVYSGVYSPSGVFSDTDDNAEPVVQDDNKEKEEELPPQEEKTTFMVFIRKRPIREGDVGRDIVHVTGPNQVTIFEPKINVDLSGYVKQHTYAFDKAYSEHEVTAKLYADARSSLITTLFYGGKTSCFIYGQSGSGKTHTMLGTEQDPGLCELAALEIFTRKTSNHLVLLRMYEIYCSDVHDLLNNNTVCQVRSDAKHKVNICGLTHQTVEDFMAFKKVMSNAKQKRLTGRRSDNNTSSRSHLIIQITVQKVNSSLEDKRHGSLNMVLLAGSEQPGKISKQAVKETAEINKSLLALKECILALASHKEYVPFRGSVLTMVLKDAFQVNSRTLMIATLRPSNGNISETLDTLKYAHMVKGLHCEDVLKVEKSVVPFPGEISLTLKRGPSKILQGGILTAGRANFPENEPELETSYPPRLSVNTGRSIRLRKSLLAVREHAHGEQPEREMSPCEPCEQLPQSPLLQATFPPRSVSTAPGRSMRLRGGLIAVRAVCAMEHMEPSEELDTDSIQVADTVQLDTQADSYYAATENVETAGGKDPGDGTTEIFTQSQGGILAELLKLQIEDIINARKFVVSSIYSLAASLKEMGHRLGFAMDVWQIVTLLFTYMSFPEEFTNLFGRLSALIAIDFTHVYEIDFQITFYLGVGIAFTALLTLLIVSIIVPRLSAEEVAALHQKIHQEKQEAKENGIEWKPPSSSKLESVAWLSLFTFSTLYLPVTRNSIQVVSCHRSVQCVFDCTLTSQEYHDAFIVAIVSGITVSVLMPLFLAWIIYNKRQEFRTFLELQNKSSYGCVEDEWVSFVRDDLSPYKSLYSEFEYRYTYMYVVFLLAKAAICIPVLACPADSLYQLAGVLTFQCLYTILVNLLSPFLNDICDWIVQTGQIYVLLTFVVSLLCKADPSNEVWSNILNISAFLNLVAQLLMAVWGIFQKKSEVEKAM